MPSADDRMGAALDGLDGKVREQVSAAYKLRGGQFSRANLPALREALKSVRRLFEQKGRWVQASDLTRREDRLEMGT